MLPPPHLTGGPSDGRTPHPAEARGLGAGRHPKDDPNSLLRSREEKDLPEPTQPVVAGDPCPGQCLRAPHPLSGPARISWTPAQEPAPRASPQTGSPHDPGLSSRAFPALPGRAPASLAPTLPRDGVPMAPLPPHTLSSLAAHLPRDSEQQMPPCTAVPEAPQPHACRTGVCQPGVGPLI